MQSPSEPTRSRGRHRRSVLVLLVGALLGFLTVGLTAGPVSAAEDGPETVMFTGTLRNAGEPVTGVEITVTSPDGEEFQGASDDSGRIQIEVPRADGEYTVALDEGTLPDDVGLREGQSAEETVTPSSLGSVPITFMIGESTREVQTKWDRVPQLLYQGLLFGIIMAMAALGLSMIFGTTGLTNFSHGELVTFGALVAFTFNSTFGLPFALAAVAAVVLGGLFGWAQDAILWRPLRKRGTGLIAIMIVSIGLMFFLRNLFQYFTEGRTQNYREHVTPSGYDLFGITVTTRDLVMAGVSITAITVVTLALSRTRLGRATRAVADNPALASSTGINVNRVISLVWIIGTALASLAGVFLGFSLGVTFQMGQLVLLLLFAAVCVGGLGSIWGALVGALIIGVLIEMSTLVIPSDLKNAGALLLLIIILLVRPQGLLGRKERIG